MVGHVNNAAFLPMIIAAEEIILRSGREIGGGAFCVLVLPDVHVVAQSDAVEDARSHRPGRHRAVIVEIDVGNIRREKDLVFLVHRHGRVLPPKERAGDGGAVGELHARLQHRFAGAQADADHPLHPLHGIMLGEPDRDGTIRLVFDRVVHGHEG